VKEAFILFHQGRQEEAPINKSLESISHLLHDGIIVYAILHFLLLVES
jgi:hypothetical protein